MAEGMSPPQRSIALPAALFLTCSTLFVVILLTCHDGDGPSDFTDGQAKRVGFWVSLSRVSPPISTRGSCLPQGEPTANVNWCEHDYVASYFVAELCNTITSLLFYVTLGAVGLRKYAAVNTYVALGYATLLTVGFGSALFHATMLREMQLLDELPMLYLVSIFLILSFQIERCAWAVLSVCTTVCAVTVAFPQYYEIFQFSFGGTVAVLVAHGIYTHQMMSHKPQMQRFAELSVYCFAIGGLAWGVEIVACKHLYMLQLHSIGWHLCSSCAAHFALQAYVQLCYVDREVRYDHFLGVLPYGMVMPVQRTKMLRKSYPSPPRS